MNDILQHPEILQLKNDLEQLLSTLKHNRDKVPLSVLKTKYKTGYENLCQSINTTATDYVKRIILSSIRIHKDFTEESISIIESTIKNSGLLKQLSNAAYTKQDITEFTNLAFALRQVVLDALQPFYDSHTVLLCTPECMDNPNTPLIPYCLVNNYILIDEKWIPFESCSSFLFRQLETSFLSNIA